MKVETSENIQFEHCEESQALARSSGMSVLYYFVCLGTLGLYPLLSLYFPSMRLCFYSQSFDMEKADGLLLHFPAQSPRFYEIKRRKVYLPLVNDQVEVLTLTVSGIIFYFDSKIKAFLRLGDFFSRKIEAVERENSARKNRDWARGLTDSQAAKLLATFGPNHIQMASNSYARCLLKTLKSPMILLQIVGVVGFYLNHLWLMSAIQALFLVYAIVLTANRKHDKHVRMRSHSLQSEEVSVLRQDSGGYIKRKIDPKKLAVGDVVVLENGLSLDADLLVLRGTCMANETTFTGENYPVWKRGFLDIVEDAQVFSRNTILEDDTIKKFDTFDKPIEPDTEEWDKQSELRNRVDFRKEGSRLDSKQLFFGDFDSEQLIFSASTVLMQEKQCSLGLVLKSGWNSRKGDLIVEMLLQKKSLRKLKKELIYLSLFLLSLGVCGIFLVFLSSRLADPQMPTDWPFIAEKAVEVIASVLPPALFLSFSISMNLGYLKLKEQGVKGRNVERLFEAARTGTVLFDKTGTLTANRSKVSLYMTREDMQKGDITVNVEELSGCRGFREVMEIMGLCHGLRRVDESDSIDGDMVDKALFDATNWSLTRAKSGLPDETSADFDNLKINREKLPFEKLQKSGDLTKFLLQIPVKPDKFFSHKMLLTKDFTYTRERLFEFTHETKRMSVVVSHPRNNHRKSDLERESPEQEGPQYKVLCKGAPENISSICRKDTLPENLDQMVRVFALKGLKAIALSAKLIEKRELSSSRKQLESQLEFLGLVFLENPLKPASRSVIRELNVSLIKTQMVTGDDIHNAISTAVAVGLVRPGVQLFIGRLGHSQGDVRFRQMDWGDLQGKWFRGMDDTRQIEDFRTQLFGGANEKDNNNQESLLSQFSHKESTPLLDVLSLASVSPFVRLALDGNSYEHILTELAQTNNQEALALLHQKTIIFARALPETKRRIVKNHKILVSKPEKLTVGFIGDGANDSKAIQTADFGVGLSEDLNSFGANFQAEIDDIHAVTKVIVEGRSTLEKMLQNFRFVLLGNVYLTLCLVVLSFRKLDFTSVDNAVTDYLFITPLALMFLLTPARGSLSLLLPSQSFLTLSIVCRIFGHILIFGGFLFASVHLVETEQTYKSPFEIEGSLDRAEMDGGFFVLNKLVFLVLICAVSGLALGIARGYPFRRSPFEANKLTLVFCAVVLVLGVLLVNDWELLNSLVVWHWVQRLARIPFIDSTLLLKVLSVGVVAGAFIFCFEKICDHYEVLAATGEAASRLKKMKHLQKLERKETQAHQKKEDKAKNPKIFAENQQITISNHEEEVQALQKKKKKRKSVQKVSKTSQINSKLTSIKEEEEEIIDVSLNPVKGPLDEALFTGGDSGFVNAADTLSFSASSFNVSGTDFKKKKKEARGKRREFKEDEDIKEFK